MDATNGLTIGATAVLVAIGLASLVGGLYMFLKARSLDRRCTAEVSGTIVAILDEGFKKREKSKKREPKEEEVVAANEAIAAKKRAYNAKKRMRAQSEVDATASTWRPIVRYAVDGEEFEVRAVRGVSQNRFKVGQPCAVHYDPAKPSYHWLAIDGMPRTFGIMLMVCGAILVVMGFGCLYLIPELGRLSGQAFGV